MVGAYWLLATSWTLRFEKWRQPLDVVTGPILCLPKYVRASISL